MIVILALGYALQELLSPVLIHFRTLE